MIDRRPINEAAAMRHEIRRLESDLASAKSRLARLEASCRHDWTDPEYTPDIREGYMTQSLMGHFTRNTDGTINAPEVYVPHEEKPKWTRTCRICGKVETTTKTNVREVRTPSF